MLDITFHNIYSTFLGTSYEDGHWGYINMTCEDSAEGTCVTREDSYILSYSKELSLNSTSTLAGSPSTRLLVTLHASREMPVDDRRRGCRPPTAILGQYAIIYS